MNPLQDKTALVTGASSGIGRALARNLAGKGANVIALARREKPLIELQKEFPQKITPITFDLSHDLEALQKKFNLSSIDILVNNAGLALGKDLIQQTPPEDWKTMFQTNVLSLIDLTQRVLPGMLERNSGDVVNLGSIAAYQTYKGGSIYNATKYAVRALTEAWRRDLCGTNVRVIGIHPGMVETEFSEVRFKGDKARAKQVYEGFQALTAEDVADSIVWALSCPRHVSVQSLVLMPTAQAAVGEVVRNGFA